MTRWFLQNKDEIGSLASLASLAQIPLVIIALAGLCYARKQINSGRAAQREATAKAVYANFLKLAFDHREYDNGPKGDGDKKYERFVGILLNACDELAVAMLCCKPPHQMWEKVISAELTPHVRYLGSPRFQAIGGWNLYSDELKSIGERIIQQTPLSH